MFTTIFTQVFSTLWFLIPLAILAALLKTPWFKGVIGEFIVNLSAKLYLDKTKYHLIKNVTLPTEDGSTQIDHIIVSKFGVFVVETKNMKGWIFGNAHQKMWTQKIFKHTNKFQNPLHQNYKHVKTLEAFLELNDQQIHSVVVFVGDSLFKTEMPENVTYGGGYIRFIKSKTECVLSDVQVIKITNKINAGKITPSFKTNREHVKHVKNIIAQKEAPVKKSEETREEKPAETVDAKICTTCQSPMILRETKKGPNIGNQFWGCSNFPKCRNVIYIN